MASGGGASGMAPAGKRSGGVSSGGTASGAVASAGEARRDVNGAAGRFEAIAFDLLTALIDSWSLYARVTGSEELGRAWRLPRRHAGLLVESPAPPGPRRQSHSPRQRTECRPPAGIRDRVRMTTAFA